MSSVLPPGKIPTGDGITAPLARFSFTAPNLFWVIEALNGMMADYSQPGGWIQDGTATPEDAAAIFSAIWETFGVDMATTGVIVPFAGGILPSGWLPCDGSIYDVSDYPSLFAVIGNVWGGDGMTTFAVPDLRGRTLLGMGEAPFGPEFSLADTDGEVTVALVTGEMPAHSHTVNLHTHSTHGHGAGLAVAPGELPVSTPSLLPDSTGSASPGTSSVGSGNPHNNMQPYAVVNYAIIT